MVWLMNTPQNVALPYKYTPTLPKTMVWLINTAEIYGLPYKTSKNRQSHGLAHKYISKRWFAL